MKKILHKIAHFLKMINTWYQKNIYNKFGVLFVVMAIIPLLSEIDLIKYSTVSLIAYILIFTIVAMGLNILLGFSGLMSLGTAGFVGFGAYGVVYFSNTVGMPYELAALTTLVIASVIGTFIGLFSLKVEGVYLAISTLAVGEVFGEIFRRVTWFTNAFGGVHYEYPTLFGFIELSRNTTYLFIVLWMIIMMIVMHHITTSKTGRAMMAMSRSKSSAQAMGVSISKYKLISFLIATVYATLGGILYASFYRYVQPLDWNLMLTLLILAMVVVGGMKSIFGTFLGAFIIYGVPKLWLEDIFNSMSGVAYIFSGVLIIVVVLFYPAGLIHLPTTIKKWYYRWREYRMKRTQDLIVDAEVLRSAGDEDE